jgi:hypothetical protein
MPEDSQKIPNYLRPDWTIGPELPSPEYDPKLEKEIDAYVSWQTIRQEFGNVKQPSKTSADSTSS